MTYPEWSFTIDGKPFEFGGWQCGADEFGYDRATGLVTEDVARSIKQGSRLVGYVNGRVGWDGRLASNPLVHRGVARIDAVGHQAQAAKYRKRYLASTRDYGLWSPADGDPYLRVVSSTLAQAKFDLQERAGSLQFMLGEPESFVSTDAHAFMMNARGTPGGITGYAFDWIISQLQFADFKTFGWDWLNANSLTIGTHGLGGTTSGSASATFAGRDQLEIQLACNGSFTLTQSWQALIRNLQVFGRATASADAKMTTSAIIADVCSLLGFDSTLVQSSSLNALPFDAIGMSALDILAHQAILDDRPAPFVGFTGSVSDYDGTITCEYHDWDDRVWTVHLSTDAAPELSRMEDFNEVRVTVPMVGGFDSEVTRTVEDLSLVDPLSGTGLRNTFDISIPDVQADFTLAQTVADTYLNYVSTPRLQGRVRIAAARGPGGITDPYGPLPGDTLRIADYGPAESMDLRISTVEWTQDTVAVGIEAQATFGLIGRAALAALRVPGTDTVTPYPTRAPGSGEPGGPSFKRFNRAAYQEARRAWKQSKPKVRSKDSPGGKKVGPGEKKALRRWRRKEPKRRRFIETIGE